VGRQHDNVLQRDAVLQRALQRVVVYCSVLQCVAVYCRVLNSQLDTKSVV